MNSPVPEKKPSTPLPRPQGGGLQVVFIAILAISLLLAVNFSGRIAAGQQIEGRKGQLDRTIATLEAQATAYQAELNYVNSNAFVEKWARKEGRMVKGEEMLVVPVPGPSTPPPLATSVLVVNTDPSQESHNWSLWWQLFFDSQPPGNNSGD